MPRDRSIYSGVYRYLRISWSFIVLLFSHVRVTSLLFYYIYISVFWCSRFVPLGQCMCPSIYSIGFQCTTKKIWYERQNIYLQIEELKYRSNSLFQIHFWICTIFLFYFKYIIIILMIYFITNLPFYYFHKIFLISFYIGT